MSEKITKAVCVLQKETLKELRSIYSLGSCGKSSIEQLVDDEVLLLANLGIDMLLKAEPAVKQAMAEEGAAYPNSAWLDVSAKIPKPSFKYLDRNAVIALEKEFEARSSSFEPYEAEFKAAPAGMRGLDRIPATVTVLGVIGTLAVIMIPGIGKKFVVPLLCVETAVGVACRASIKRFVNSLLGRAAETFLPSGHTLKPVKSVARLDYSILTEQTCAANEQAVADWYKQLEALAADAVESA